MNAVSAAPEGTSAALKDRGVQVLLVLALLLGLMIGLATRTTETASLQSAASPPVVVYRTPSPCIRALDLAAQGFESLSASIGALRDGEPARASLLLEEMDRRNPAMRSASASCRAQAN